MLGLDRRASPGQSWHRPLAYGVICTWCYPMLNKLCSVFINQNNFPAMLLGKRIE